MFFMSPAAFAALDPRDRMMASLRGVGTPSVGIDVKTQVNAGGSVIQSALQRVSPTPAMDLFSNALDQATVGTEFANSPVQYVTRKPVFGWKLNDVADYKAQELTFVGGERAYHGAGVRRVGVSGLRGLGFLGDLPILQNYPDDASKRNQQLFAGFSSKHPWTVPDLTGGAVQDSADVRVYGGLLGTHGGSPGEEWFNLVGILRSRAGQRDGHGNIPVAAAYANVPAYSPFTQLPQARAAWLYLRDAAETPALSAEYGPWVTAKAQRINQVLANLAGLGSQGMHGLLQDPENLKVRVTYLKTLGDELLQVINKAAAAKSALVAAKDAQVQTLPQDACIAAGGSWENGQCVPTSTSRNNQEFTPTPLDLSAATQTTRTQLPPAKNFTFPILRAPVKTPPADEPSADEPPANDDTSTLDPSAVTDGSGGPPIQNVPPGYAVQSAKGPSALAIGAGAVGIGLLAWFAFKRKK